MNPILLKHLITASGLLSTTYGYREGNCGDIGKPVKCAVGAVTASGEKFDPNDPVVAIAMPTGFRLEATYVYLRMLGEKCKLIKVVDKMNPRYIGKRGFDLTPAAIEYLSTVEPANRYWVGKLYYCKFTDILSDRVEHYEEDGEAHV